MYKALDLAHDYQEKCKQLTAEKRELEERMQKTAEEKDDVITKKNKEIEALKENCETVMRLNKQSTDCVKNLEDALGKVCNYLMAININGLLAALLVYRGGLCSAVNIPALRPHGTYLLF